MRYHITEMLGQIIGLMRNVRHWDIDIKQWRQISSENTSPFGAPVYMQNKIDGWQGILWDKQHNQSYLLTICPIRSVMDVKSPADIELQRDITETEFRKMWEDRDEKQKP